MAPLEEDMDEEDIIADEVAGEPETALVTLETATADMVVVGWMGLWSTVVALPEGSARPVPTEEVEAGPVSIGALEARVGVATTEESARALSVGLVMAWGAAKEEEKRASTGRR
jgi:hypothetical protein